MTNFIKLNNHDCKTEFENLKQILITELKNFEIDIQHVGSTSIPGLYAKPVLDIDIIVVNKLLLGNITARLEKIGYISKGEQGIIGRFAFRQLSDLTPSTDTNRKWQEHHLYVCFSDSLALKNHILFRDTLLRDSGLENEYSQLKMNLIKEKGMTKEKYTKGKTEFITFVLTSIRLDEKELNAIKNANI